MINFKGAVLTAPVPVLFFITQLISICICTGSVYKTVMCVPWHIKNKKSERREEITEEIIYLNTQQRRKMDVQHQEPFAPSQPKDK